MKAAAHLKAGPATTPPPGAMRPLALAVALALGALACGAAHAQGAGRSSGFAGSFDASLSHVDSVRDSGSSSELITEVRPGFQYFSRSGAVRGSVNYGLGLVNRSRRSPESEVSHQLAAGLNAQLLENHAYVDISAAVGKQSVSAFGQQSVETTQGDNPNLQEVGTLSITPTLRGALGGVAVYDLRLNLAGTNTRRSIAGDSTTKGGSLSLGSPPGRAVIGWNLTGSRTVTDFRATGESTLDRAVATLTAAPDVDVSLSLRAGRESTDAGGNGVQVTDNWGVSARWTPTPRTTAEFNTDHRFFGRSHSVTLSHRMALSTLRFTSVRDIALSANPRGLGQAQTLYDLFFTQFASQEPDESARQALVLNFLNGLGLDPNASVGGGGVVPGPTLQERQDLSWSYALRRLTLTMQAFASKSTQLGSGGAVASAGNPSQRGYTGTVSYRLTPTGSVSLTGSRRMTRPTDLQAGTDLKSLSTSFNDRISRSATLGLSARYTVFNSVVNAYREAAVTASLGMQF